MIAGRRHGETGQRSNLIIKIAIVGIAIGMAVMILATSIVAGFQEEIRNKVIGFGSHLQITLYNSQNTIGIKPMAANPPFIEELKANSLVKNVQSYALKSGVITANNEIEGILAKGIDESFNWTFFETNLKAGKAFKVLEDETNDSVLISESVLKRLNLSLNDKITVSFFQDERERKRRFIIGGVYSTGMEQFDGSIMLCDIKHVQKLNNWDSNQVAGYEVLLNRFEDLQYLDFLSESYIPYQFTTLKITDQFMDIFGWLELQDMNVVIILTLMILVSGINMISALLVLILERTNMIGLLKAMGAKTKSIAQIFLYNAAYLILLGMLIGNAFGISLAWLQAHYKWVKLDQKNYYVDHVPVLLKWDTLVLLNLGSIAACLIMLLLPSLLVSRINPVKTIKFN
jgi:lipoprotein-releasing system permease protein